MGEYDIIHIEFLVKASENPGKTNAIFQIRLTITLLAGCDHGDLIGIERKPIFALKLILP
jgi:hypothetical protein